MPVKQYRVDSRMLHGQVVTAYGRVFKIDEFIVVNEEVSKDPLQTSLLQLAAMGSVVHVFSPQEAKDFIEGNKFKGRSTLVVYKEIEDVVEMVELGFKLEHLQIGSMFEKKDRDRVKYDQTLFVDDIDRKAFRYLEDSGVELSYQLVPDYREKKLHDLVDY